MGMDDGGAAEDATASTGNADMATLAAADRRPLCPSVPWQGRSYVEIVMAATEFLPCPPPPLRPSTVIAPPSMPANVAANSQCIDWPRGGEAEMASCAVKRRVGTWKGVLYRSLSCACVLVVIPTPAKALELSGGVNLGLMMAGTVPRLAVSPNAGISWGTESGVLFAVHDQLSILPATSGAGAGVYNQTSAAVGYATTNANFSVGPSLSIYSMLTCGVTWCGRVVGAAPGGHAQVSLYFAGPLGVSLSAGVDWVGGRSIVLPGGVAATVVAGPIVRWGPR